MSGHPFRFGVVATPQNAGHWRATAHRVVELGYATLLMPDGLQLLSPFPALATAAACADVRVGTFVLAAPLRPPHTVAWEAHSMTVLTEGRFELGIGAGLPHAATAAVEQLGLPLLSPGQRLTAVGDAIDHLRALDGDTHTPVLVAAGGPRARALAAEKADIITLAAPPLTPRAELAAMATEIRSIAGHRAEEIELCMNLFVIGEHLPPWAKKFIGADAATLIAHDSLTMLQGTTQEMTDELQRRRDQLGISYICVSAAFHEQMAPVVDALNGR